MRSSLILGMTLAVAMSSSVRAETLPSPDMIVHKQADMAAAPTAAAPAEAAAPVAQPMAAAPPADSDTDYGAIPALPLEVMTAGGVKYVNGGISDEELDELKTIAGSYNLQARIVGAEGEYVSDVAIKLTDASGAAVLSVADVGPFLYVAVKPGNYKLEATHNGVVQTLKIKIGDKAASKQTIRVAD